MVNATAFEEQVRETFQEAISTTEKMLLDHDIVSTIARVCDVLVSAFRDGRKVMLFGNGGSAADAQHIAAEFVGRFGFDRAALPALALSVNTSCLTAIGNDYGFDVVFSRQIEALGREGDVAIGISTSGNSLNVVRGLQKAKELGLHTAGFAGCAGGEMRNVADYCICAPSPKTPRIQECHIKVGHVIAEIVERELFL